MAITYKEGRRLIQPLFQRYRNIFRGPRSSHLKNLEMNKILIDLKRLDEKADNLNEKLYKDIQIFMGQVDPLLIQVHEEYEDGKYYIFENVLVDYFGDSATPTNLTIDTVSTMAGKLSRINEKVKKLEKRRFS